MLTTPHAHTATPRVSVITPAFNEKPRLGKAVGSLSAQTFNAGIEHIIVDGGSADGTPDAAERYAAAAPYTVKVLRDTGDGVYDALNAGIKAAHGHYIATLHANDAFTTPDALDRAVRMLESTGADLLYADLHFVNRKGRRVRYYSAARFRPQLLADGFMPPHPTIVARRSLFDTVGLYDSRFRIAGDFDWLCRAMLLHKAQCVYLPLDMVEMSTGGISGRWRNRLWFTNREKYLSLRANGLKICPLRLLKRYLYL